MKIAVLSDIHGNIEAFRTVKDKIVAYDDLEGVVMLGDLIDYGPHSNEVIDLTKSIELPVLCNIRGNHEKAIIDENYERFSSERGKSSARYTREQLDSNSWEYITQEMFNCGKYEFRIGEKKCLAIHGSLEDEYWKAIKPGQDLSEYKDYDYVFSGHSHLPHVFAEYYKCDNAKMRNKKKTIFINPGSVGQPRNHNPNAQFVVLDTETNDIHMISVEYDIKKEQQAFSDEVDIFYKERLEVGV